ncbi:unnamed protein product [Hydatigera taeniaeformis]|uniref:Uncharacterized protein n=1 Tax=Hydatigena taeniaeformis TaxID=6205 RepID=A0A0R3X9I9_HYDTA|nr:unnamed protein product [Hydatigera taeniaeformis]
MTMRHESWNRFCQNTSNRLAIEALQLFKAHLNDNRQDDQPGCGREFLDSICLGIRKKFELSLSQRYFVSKEDCTKFHISKGWFSPWCASILWFGKYVISASCSPICYLDR